MNIKKVVAVLYALLAVALLAAQCVAPAPTAAPPAEQPKEEAVAPAEEKEEAPAKEVFLDVGQHPPITMLINDSPWFGGFEKLVGLYEEQTGNMVNLDVTPFAGMLEKTRNAVRDTQSPYELLNINSGWYVEMYEGDFLTPLLDIDPNFELDPGIITYDDSIFWNAEKNWTTRDGQLLTVPINGNLQLFYYRADLYEEAGLEPPETWDDVYAACETFQLPDDVYCYVVRGERGNAIRFNWMPYMVGYGASVEKDPENGDYTVTLNSPEAKQALDLYIDLAKKYGPPNSGQIGQSDMIQLLVTGKAVHEVMVAAAWPNMDNPEKSVVVGKVNVTVIPKPVDGEHSTSIGHWVGGIPRNVSDEGKQAALAFLKWFQTYDAQYKYAEFGSVPVHQGAYESDLSEKPEFRWMKAMAASTPYASLALNYREGPQVEEVLGLRLNQALVGELTSAQALNLAAEEIYEIFKASGRNTGMIEKLPE
jgi:multiple sugar transport system substrate-binding protein